MRIKLKLFFQQTWNILLLQTLIISFFSNVSSILSLKLPDVFWNKTNSMFKTSNNVHVIEVNSNDEIDFVCPFYGNSGLDPDYHEYYVIHKVSRYEYENCNINPNSAQVVVNCNKPHVQHKYTLTFTSFLPILNGIEFKQGETYYFITTSTGNASGLNNTYRGACYQNNMKLIIQVCCDQSSQGCAPPVVPGCCSCTDQQLSTISTPALPPRTHHASVSTSVSSTSAPTTRIVRTPSTRRRTLSTSTVLPSTTTAETTTTRRVATERSTSVVSTVRTSTQSPVKSTMHSNVNSNEVDPPDSTTNKNQHQIGEATVIHKQSKMAALLITLTCSLFLMHCGKR